MTFILSTILRGYGTDKFLTGGRGGCLDYLSLGSLSDTGFPCPQ